VKRFALAIFLTPVMLASVSWAGLCRSVLTAQKKSNFNLRMFVPRAQWSESQSAVSSRKILENISPSDALPGAVIAGRSRSAPNYYFHWIRDAALVVDALTLRMGKTPDPVEREEIRKKVNEYVEFSGRIQKLPTPSGLGEPKVNVDGTVFTDPWGRPQNDSPALRAISMIRIAKIQKSEMRSTDASISLINKDLDYVAEHWQEPTFDLWEEVLGTHFYTRMVQRRALYEGEMLSRNSGDSLRAQRYSTQWRLIEKDLLENFWNRSGDYVGATSKQDGGLQGKTSNLDIAVVLGMLHGSTGDSVFKFSDPKFLSTLRAIESEFKRLYLVNKNASAPGIAVGRYPEDNFSGSNHSGGNPWVLATLAMAEAYYRVAGEMKAAGRTDWQAMVNKGDQFVARVQYHANADGSLNEQIDRNSGYMTSVADLSWSHAAILTAFTARSKVMEP
jgi:glucoamylase